VKRVLLAAFILLGIAFCAAQTAPNLPGPPYTTYTAALDRVALEQQGARVQFPAFTGAAALLSIGINNSHCLGQEPTLSFVETTGNMLVGGPIKVAYPKGNTLTTFHVTYLPEGDSIVAEVSIRGVACLKPVIMTLEWVPL